jgi:DNA-binding NarL/FixJ family response regulator
VVELTLEEPELAGLIGGEIAWHSTAQEVRAAIARSPVEGIVFQVSFDDRHGLVDALREVRQSRPELKTLLAATAATGMVLAEIISLVPRRVVQRMAPLTVRESQVLGAIKSGHTNREIADRLGISLSTVNRHVENILHKLSVRNRTQAAAESPKSDHQLPSRGNGHSLVSGGTSMDPDPGTPARG